MKCLLSIPLLLLALAAACSGGDAVDLTDREITDAELMAMVLPQEELGDAYADFDLDEDSGFQSKEDLIANAFDEEDEAEDLERFGWIKSFGEDYVFLDNILAGEGVIGISSSVELYATADGAAGRLVDETEDIKRTIGIPDEADGSILDDFQEFDVKETGDEALGLIFEVSVPIANGEVISFNVSGVVLRRGRILGVVGISHLDDRDVQDEVAELARKLDERIQAVLRGELE